MFVEWFNGKVEYDGVTVFTEGPERLVTTKSRGEEERVGACKGGEEQAAEGEVEAATFVEWFNVKVDVDGVTVLTEGQERLVTKTSRGEEEWVGACKGEEEQMATIVSILLSSRFSVIIGEGGAGGRSGVRGFRIEGTMLHLEPIMHLSFSLLVCIFEGEYLFPNRALSCC